MRLLLCLFKSMFQILPVFLGLMISVVSQSLLAEGRVLEIEGATIRGNQELPTVLYVVPWQPAKVYSLDKPKQSLASERPISTIERAPFQRLLRYHQSFQTKVHSQNHEKNN